MRSKQTTKKIIFFSVSLLVLFVINLILVLLFKYYQPECEPCLDGVYCPPCLSQEQFFIIYYGGTVNILLLIIIYLIAIIMRRK